MNKVWNGFKGVAIGIAEVIPGVSGGTIAFITGIYEKLINSIRGFDLEFIRLIFKGQPLLAWNRVNGTFLISLFLGMVIGLVVGIIAVSGFLESHPPVVWGFFFGLIVASAWYILSRIERLNVAVIAMVILGAVVAYGITILSPAEGTTNYLAVFLAGNIAICALILPGISGSFILLLLGMYTIILGEARNFISSWDLQSLLVLVVFVLGALLGLMVFTRIVSWLLDRYKRIVFGLLCGFMIGSLNKIWPWRDPVVFLDDSGEIFMGSAPPGVEWRVLQESNKWPAEYLSGDPLTFAVIVAAVIGFLIVIGMDWADRKKL